MREPSDHQKSLAVLAQEAWQLSVAYVKQETIEPLKQLGRFVGLGLAGAALLGLGFTLLVLGGLRALQTETGTAFTGNLSFLPYAFALAACALVALVAMKARSRGQQRRRQRQ